MAGCCSASCSSVYPFAWRPRFGWVVQQYLTASNRYWWINSGLLCGSKRGWWVDGILVARQGIVMLPMLGAGQSGAPRWETPGPDDTNQRANGPTSSILTQSCETKVAHVLEVLRHPTHPTTERPTACHQVLCAPLAAVAPVHQFSMSFRLFVRSRSTTV